MPFLDRPGRRRPSKRAKARWGDAQRQLLRAWQRRLGPRPSLRDLLVTEYVAAGLLRAASTYRHGIHDDITTRLPRIGVPTLVVRGANDRIVTASWARRATGLLADGRLRTVTGADHSGQFAAAEPIAELVAEFLEDGPVDPMPR
jgi:pimeloyl-ACP methyl ester carboxylesterase